MSDGSNGVNMNKIMSCCKDENMTRGEGGCGECACANDTMKMPLIGKELPDMEFEAYQNEKIKDIKLSDYHGKWLILFFYPKDFTFVCPTELEEMAEHYEEFKKLNTEVLSVSRDTVYVHKAWHDVSEAVGKVQYPMISDPTGKLCTALGVNIDDEGVSLRATFVVNPEGKIVSMEVNSNDIGRSAGELVRKLQAAQFVAEHGGNVCPASWKPGDEPLKPGLDLVGKI